MRLSQVIVSRFLKAGGNLNDKKLVAGANDLDEEIQTNWTRNNFVCCSATLHACLLQTMTQKIAPLNYHIKLFLNIKSIYSTINPTRPGVLDPVEGKKKVA